MGIFYLTLESGGRKLAIMASLLLAVMILIGGSYHAVFTVFGFAARVADAAPREELVKDVTMLRTAIGYPMYIAGLAGTALVYLVALSKKTEFPRWLLIFMPTILSLASSAFHGFFIRIPTPLGGIIRGGWINGSFVLFFAIATCVFWRDSGDHRAEELN